MEMSTLWPQLEPLLSRVAKPARYIGGEEGSATVEHHPDKVAWLVCYPDAYEIGLPNQGLQILYEILNERPDALAERAYAPWVDLEAELRAAGLPLFSVEGHRPATDFDVFAVNLSTELNYTNLVNLIDLAGMPVRSARRDGSHPLVIVGGHCALNPEPVADFIDAAVLGDGEEVVGEITEVLAAAKHGADRWGSGRTELLVQLAQIPGVYVPSLYEVVYDGPRLVSVEPRAAGVPPVVERRALADLADWPYPRRQLVPLTEVVHDRLNVEVFRGCTRGCRFCQAGMVTRPVRERPADQVRTMVAEGLGRTGYDEVALTSLSTADFSGIEEVVRSVVDGSAECGQASVSLPSLRVDAFTVGIAAQVQTRPAHRTDLRPRGRHVADAPGHQQAHRRRGPHRSRRERVLPGVAPGEAVLPRRSTHRDRRGHAGDHGPGKGLCGHRPPPPQRCLGHRIDRWLRAQAPHPVPVVRSEQRG